MKWSQALALYLFWPVLLVVAWGELIPHPPAFAALVWDKAEHFSAYFGLAAMAAVVLKADRRTLWSAAALVVLGGVLEIVQGFTGRDPSIYDELANTLGVVSGSGCGWALIRLLRPKILPAAAR